MPKLPNETEPRKVAATELEQACFDLRKGGATYREIAKKLSTTEATAHRSVKRVLARIRKLSDDDAEALRDMEVARLDYLLLKIATQIEGGHLGAVDRALKIMERRTKLLGLDAPARAPVDERGEAVRGVVIDVGQVAK